MSYLYSPGSKDAIDKGCTCPILDNYYGLGIGIDTNGEIMFWIDAECPLHGSKIINEDANITEFK